MHVKFKVLAATVSMLMLHSGAVRAQQAPAITIPPVSLVGATGAAANASSEILTATNLTPRVNWQPIYINVPGNSGVWQFTDTNPSQYPMRFYRTSTPQ